MPFLEAGGRRQCGPCRAETSPFNRARAAAEYGGAIASAIQRFKYGKALDILPHLSPFLHLAARSLAPPDLIIPIPLHPRRLRQRGFNQSALLARSFARKTRVPWDPSTLIRIRDTPTQTGLSRRLRKENIEGAFRALQPRRIVGINILLIDDVITTGATVREGATTLKRAGAVRIDIIALARSVDSNY